MKRILSLISVFTLLLYACTGPQGPPGFDGLDGFDGINADEYAAKSFEVSPVNFEFSSNSGLQEVIISLPYNILDSDVILVYRLDEVVNVNSQATDAWSPLPQNFFLDNSDIIQYVFNHTYVDVKLMIDGNFNLSTLSTNYTKNQVFRIVIVPADAINSIDISNINTIINAFNIREFATL